MQFFLDIEIVDTELTVTLFAPYENTAPIKVYKNNDWINKAEKSFPKEGDWISESQQMKTETTFQMEDNGGAEVYERERYWARARRFGAVKGTHTRQTKVKETSQRKLG